MLMQTTVYIHPMSAKFHFSLCDRRWLMSPMRALKTFEQCGQRIDAADDELICRDFLASLRCSAKLFKEASHATAPLQRAAHHATLSFASHSQAWWFMPKALREIFSESLKRFFLATLGAFTLQQLTIEDNFWQAVIRHTCVQHDPPNESVTASR